MFLNINVESSEPIYRQIYLQIKEMINQGMLPANSKLPSTREMAVLLKVSDIDELKRSFLNLIALEEGKIFNYGYARGYKPLIDTLLEYMASKGVDTKGKAILITNGFTEAFDIILSWCTYDPRRFGFGSLRGGSE